VEKLIMGVGAIAELQKAHYDVCVKQGFTKTQAIELTKNFITAMLLMGGSYPPPE
jgi:hypothetical protein